MDPKRGNAAPARQVGQRAASKTSVSAASRHFQPKTGGVAATMGRRYGSEVSLTPSQAKRDVDNPRKSPLDALSRGATLRQDPFQRRSGLQDVDDAFMSSNAFARPSRLRNSGLDGTGSTMRQPAGQQEQPQMAVPVPQQQQQPPVQVQQQQVPPVVAVPSQQQLQQQQYMQMPAAGQPTRLEPAPTGRAHVHQQQAAYEQQLQQQQPEAQAIPQQQQQQPPQQQAPVSPNPAQQQQPQSNYPAQPPVAGAGAGGAAPPPDAEMCTTCPNCQTTIYLVRTPELGHGDAGSTVQ